MNHDRLGQSQVVTAVLLGGILVVGISSAYTWGIPLLEKNQDASTLEDTLSSFETLGSEIESISRRGGGSQVTFNVGDGVLQINPENNSIEYAITTRAAYVSTSGWVSLNDNNMRGLFEGDYPDQYGVQGQDTPGVIIARARDTTEGYRTTYKLKFREMRDVDSGVSYQIDLQDDGNLEANGGTHEIVFSFDEEVSESGASTEGDELVRRLVDIRLE